MSRRESMRHHPAGKHIPPSPEVVAMIHAAQDQQAMDLANRGLVEAELFAGGRMRQVNHDRFEVPGPRFRWLDVVGPVAIVLVFFAVVFGFAALAGGWPL